MDYKNFMPTKYLNRNFTDTSIELMINSSKEVLEKQIELIKKITTKEEYNELIEEYKKISGNEKVLDSQLNGKTIKSIREVRKKDNDEEYIYSKFTYMNKTFEMNLDYETVSKYGELYSKILNFSL